MTDDAGTATGTAPGSVPPPASVPERALTPYLAVDDARRAIDWYAGVFGARVRLEPYVMDDGRVGHAGLVIGDSVLMLADEFPEIGLLGPRARGGASQSLQVLVADVDGTVERALGAGAQLAYPVRDEDYGRRGAVDDPFGHRWIVAAAPGPEPEPPAPAEASRHGDIGYVSITLPDDGRAQDFYGAVLGWRFTPGSVPRGWQVDGPTPMVGLLGGVDPPEVQLCYRVDDAAAASRLVREHGGRAEAPQRRPYGLLVECVDDQGVRFQLWEPPAS